MSVRSLSVTIGALVTLAASLATGASAAPGAALSLEEALARAESLSPLVRRARAELALATAARAGAAVPVPYNPVVSVGAGRRFDASASRPPSDGAEWGLRLEQTVEIAGQRGTRLQEVARLREVAELRARFMRAETHARVRSAYIGLQLAEAAAAAAARSEELGRRLLESVQARVQAGAASDVELRLAEVEGGRLRHERLEAELARSGAAAGLRLLLALPAGAPLTLTSPLARPGPPAALDALLAAAEARRADLEALARVGSQLDAVIVRLRREVVPSPTLFVEVGQAQPGQTWVGGGVALPLPLWQRNQGPLALARAERERAGVERELLGREIAEEVVARHAALTTRLEEVALWDERILLAAEANVELVTGGWRAGKLDLFRVIQVSREAAEARRRRLEVLGQTWDADIALARATGAL